VENVYVPISADVIDHSGNRVDLVARPGINDLVDHARAEGMPMLGWVDPYGHTTFNRLQMQLVRPELERLQADVPALSELVDQLLALTDIVAQRPHRCLRFLGD
jgi:hypothetical protein